MIELKELHKRYGEFAALRGISTSVSRGEVVGLLGPNGAGKTTTMKILVGYLLPTSGSAMIDGLDVVEQPREVQRKVGYLPENSPVYEEMLVQEYLAFIARMRDLAEPTARKRIVAAIDECGLGHVLTRPISQLSKGYHQRVGLAAAILHDPELLILDEPTSGLDPNQIVEVRELIRQMGRAKTVILSTHILSEVEATCDRAVILIDGEIRADGRLEQLTASRTQVVSLAPGDPQRARERFAALEGVAAVELTATEGRFCTFRLQLDGAHELGERIAEIARAEDWPLRELRRDDRTLEQVFRELTESPVEVA